MEKDTNRRIHEWLGKCWHDLVLGKDDVWRCNEIDCRLEVPNYGDMHGDPKGNPDYTTSYYAMGELLEAVRAKGYEFEIRTHVATHRWWTVSVVATRRPNREMQESRETLPAAVAAAVIRLIEGEEKTV
jgi:hypothetical protein